jgi:hypothetical protein
MKNRLFVFSFILFTLLIGIKDVNASSCDKYGCASCKYVVDNYEITYDITSSQGDIKIRFSTDKLNTSNESYRFYDNLTKYDFKDGDYIVCPSNIFSVYKVNSSMTLVYLENSDKEGGNKIMLSSKSTNNNITISGKPSDRDINSGDILRKENSTSCPVLSNDFIEFMQLILDYIRIAALVLTIILSIMDYTVAIFGPDEKSNIKANKRFTTRLIILAVLFLVPSILIFALKLFNIAGSGDSGTCGIY